MRRPPRAPEQFLDVRGFLQSVGPRGGARVRAAGHEPRGPPRHRPGPRRRSSCAVACTFLGRWQWNRHVWRDGAIAVVETNWSADPVPLDAVLPTPDAPLTDDDVWRRVDRRRALRARRHRPAAQPARRRHARRTTCWSRSSSRTRRRTAADRRRRAVLVVDRGWVPPGADGERRRRPARARRRARSRSPRGCATTSRRRTATRPPGRSRRSRPSRSWRPAASRADRTDGLRRDDRGGPVRRRRSPAPLPAPSTDPGSHLSYAFQWWTFALGGLVAFCLAPAASCRTSAPRRTRGPGAGAADGDRRRRRAVAHPGHPATAPCADGTGRPAAAAAGATRTPRTRSSTPSWASDGRAVRPAR